MSAARQVNCLCGRVGFFDVPRPKPGDIFEDKIQKNIDDVTLVTLPEEPNEACPVMVNNVATSYKNYDTLMNKNRALGHIACEKNKCASSLQGCLGYARNGINATNRTLEARDFFLEYFQEINRMDSFEQRWKEVSESIATEGSYEFTLEELTFGAKTAWRNAPRCIGRMAWQTLRLRDCRHVDNVEDMFVEICKHIKESTNGGQIVPSISVFPQRKPGCKDTLRLWNGQFLSYAGYAHPDDPNVIIGDRGNVSFTQFCQSLGWQGKGGRFDILPIILSGADGVPKVFEIPEEIVMRVKITHPELTQIDNMGLEWYAFPGVSNMLLEIGGQQFPAAPFSGWYLVTEVAVRDFLDEHRYDLLQDLANTIGYDTSSIFWKDSVCVDMCVAVLHSFRKAGVAMNDHHSMSKRFVEFYNREHQVRGGCPSDWLWINPPMSSSLTPVFHQEMLNYRLSPSIEYQEPLWRMFKADSSKKRSLTSVGLALWFISRLFMKRYQRRKKAVILYGTMTGTSRAFSSTLEKCLDQLFQTTVMALDDHSFELLKNMALSDEKSTVFIITSTTGNGEPPNHAIGFKSTLEDALEANKADLKGLHYAVLALGSTTYENFGSFGTFCHETIRALGGQEVAPLILADELKGQDRAFKQWTQSALTGACKVLEVEVPKEVHAAWPFSRAAARKISWQPQTSKSTSRNHDMKKLHGTTLQNVDLLNTMLVAKKKMSERYYLFTLGFPFNPSITFKPGDHVYIFPENDPQMVEKLMEKLAEVPAPAEVVSWDDCDVPPATLTKVLTAYLDICSTLTPDLMLEFSQFATSQEEKDKIVALCDDSEFQEWRSKRPNVLDFIMHFPSLRIPASFFVARMKKLMPRPYSVASIYPKFSLVGGQNIPVTDLLIEACKFQAGPFQDNAAFETRNGVASNFMVNMQSGQRFLAYHYSNPCFSMPNDSNVPVIMICAGSGIAPFRPFWQKREMNHMPKDVCWLYFGCRDNSEDLFANETSTVVQRNVAFSRIGDKIYVQDLLERDAVKIYDLLINKNANVYICGQVSMATGVKKRLVEIFMRFGNKTLKEGQEIIHQMRRNAKLEEEYFG